MTNDPNDAPSSLPPVKRSAVQRVGKVRGFLIAGAAALALGGGAVGTGVVHVGGAPPAPIATPAARPTALPGCSTTWSLNDGFRPGQITAGEGVLCAGVRHPGTISLKVSLSKLDPVTKKWRVQRTGTGTWKTLGAHHFVELHQPCSTGRFRGSFTATLRDSRGRVVGTTTTTTPGINVATICLPFV